MEDVTKYIFERIKSTDFPLECRAMYYFAKGRHEHQTRKVTGKPYYIHPRGVAYIVMMMGGTTDQINAAFGHDLLEDTDTSFTEIKVVSGSYHCAEICSELRNNRFTIDDIGKETYMSQKLVGMSDDALMVKLSDILYNMLDCPTDKGMERMKINVDYLLQNRKDIPENCMKIISFIMKHSSEKHSEQEPKFRPGNWIIYETEGLREILKVKYVDSEGYHFTDQRALCETVPLSEEKNMCLWSIDQAKPGDVFGH